MWMLISWLQYWPTVSNLQNVNIVLQDMGCALSFGLPWLTDSLNSHRTYLLLELQHVAGDK